MKHLALILCVLTIGVFFSVLFSTESVIVYTKDQADSLPQATPYETLLASTQQTQPIIPTQLSDNDIDTRFTGLLSHVRWLINQNADDRGYSRSRNDRDDSLIWRQIDSIMDDNSEDFQDISEEFDTSILTVESEASIAGTLTVTGTTTLANTIANSLQLLSTIPVATQNLLYNTAGDLYWGGNLIAGSAIGNWASNGVDVYRLTGNVGIGTSTPSSPLTVWSNQSFTTVSAESPVGTGRFSVSGSSGAVGFLATGVFTETDNDVIIYNSNTISSSSIAINSRTSEGDINFYTGGNPTSSRLRLTVTESGNVGIGSAAPAARLAVLNNTASNTLLIEDQLSDPTPIVVDADGNMGIGTTTPDNILTIKQPSQTSGLKIIDSASPLAIRLFQGTSGFQNLYFDDSFRIGTEVSSSESGLLQSGRALTLKTFNNASNGYINFDINGTEVMRVANSGNVGIGTSTPAAKLDVIGGALDSDFRITRSGVVNSFVSIKAPAGPLSSTKIGLAGTDRLEIANNGGILVGSYIGGSIAPSGGLIVSGNVGIGTSSPQNRLHIGTVSDNSNIIQLDAAQAGTTHGLLLVNSGAANWMIGRGSGRPSTNGIGFKDEDAGNFPFWIEDGATSNLLYVTDTTPVGLGPQTQSVLGIGTSTPTAKAHVLNTLPVDSFRVDDVLGDMTPFLIDQDGNVGIGTSTPSARLTVTGTVRFANITNGTLQADALGNITVSSDERLKDIAGAYEAGLDEILGLEPIQYNWSVDSGFDTETLYAGFSAQNVRDFLPAAVGENPDGFLTLSDRPILAALVNAVKEVWERLTGVEDRVEVLERRVLELEAALNQAQSQPASYGDAVAPESSPEPMIETEPEAAPADISNEDPTPVDQLPEVQVVE